MLFLLVRISPVLIPIVYFFLLRALASHVHQWHWLLLASILLNLACFALLANKLKRKRVWFILVYSSLFAALGFGYAFLLGSSSVLYIFMIVWSLIYLVYLESVFNYFYRTQRLFLIELKNISAYSSLLMLFITVFVLTSLHIFFGFAWWWALLIYAAIAFVLLFDRFLIQGFDHRTNFLYSGIISLVLVEVYGALMWWTVSAYVLAIVVATGYYLLSSLTLSAAIDKLSRKNIIQYVAVAVIVLILVLITARWI